MNENYLWSMVVLFVVLLGLTWGLTTIHHRTAPWIEAVEEERQ